MREKERERERERARVYLFIYSMLPNLYVCIHIYNFLFCYSVFVSI